MSRQPSSDSTPRRRIGGQLARVAAAATLAACGLAVLSGCSKSDGSTVETPVSAMAPPTATAKRVHLVDNLASLASVSGAMETADDASAVDGKCLRIKLGEGKTPETAGSATFTVNIPEAKTAKIWLRCYWSGTCSNSLMLKVPGFPDQIVGEDETYGAWHWVEGPTFPLPAGDLVLTLAQREDDIKVDQVVITANTRFRPMGIEK